jgi:hypothetical protein
MSTTAESTTKPPQRDDNDIVWGAQAIADYIGQPLSRTRYLIRKGRLPVARLGSKTIISRKKKLDRALAITAD